MLRILWCDSLHREPTAVSIRTDDIAGETSSFVVASSLGKRLNRFNEDDSSVSASRRENPQQGPQTEDRVSSTDVPGLQTLLDTYDYVMPLNTPIRRYRSLQQDVADRHLDNFFATIHVYFPIFDISGFRAKYARLRELFGSNLLHAPNGDSQGQQQSLCLLYAILALGALYAADEDSSSWATWYFSEAQELLGRLYDAVNLQLVQAAMFMVFRAIQYCVDLVNLEAGSLRPARAQTES